MCAKKVHMILKKATMSRKCVCFENTEYYRKVQSWKRGNTCTVSLFVRKPLENGL